MKAKLLIPLLALLVGCNAANKPLTEAQKQAVLKEAEPVVKSFFDAIIANDTAKMMSYVYDNPETDLILPVGIFTCKEMRKFVSQYFAMVEKQSVETKIERYSVIDKTSFVYSWLGRNVVYLKEGNPIVNEDLFDSYTFMKTGDGWKIIHMHESLKDPDVPDPVQFFTKIENEWGDAIYRKDAKVLDRIYADEYMYIDIKGNVINKQQNISDVTGSVYKALTPLELSDINVKMYGTVAVVTGKVKSTFTYNGVKTSGSQNFMDIFTYRDGRWQCILTQYIQKPEK